MESLLLFHISFIYLFGKTIPKERRSCVARRRVACIYMFNSNWNRLFAYDARFYSRAMPEGDGAASPNPLTISLAKII